ncbi:Agmatine coumaroyltransferase-2 [Platanthera guangdongensis]|uniref:Agmatine coumaroyltransferase-2 n=1 Tax=Platanthera guangdongensis TaxID=2320717 RepID=A0ABR2N569_9ASPA
MLYAPFNGSGQISNLTPKMYCIYLYVHGHAIPPAKLWQLQIFAAAPASAELTCTVTNLKVRFSANFIAELKSQVPGGCSTFEVLLAHLWRKISSARGLRATEETKVRVAVNGRARLNSLPNIPMEHYFGNLVLWAHPKLTVGDLIPAGGRGGLSAAVRIIHEAVGKIDDGYFRSFIDFGKLEEGKEGELVAAAPAPENVLYPNLEVDSWLRFMFHELDFGSGGRARSCRLICRWKV